MSDDTKPTNLPPPCVKRPPCRERPAIGTEVVFLRSVNGVAIGARAVVSRHSTWSSDNVEVRFGDGGVNMVVGWRVLGIPVVHGAEQPDAAALKLPLPCTERPPVGAKVILLKGPNAGKVLTVIRRLEDRPTLVAASDGDYTGAFDYLDLGLAPVPASPPPCTERPPLGAKVMLLRQDPGYPRLPIGAVGWVHGTDDRRPEAVSVRFERSMPHSVLVLWSILGLAPAASGGIAPCTERPAINTEVILLAHPRCPGYVGQRARVISWHETKGIALSLHEVEARFYTTFDCVGLAPVLVAPPAPAGDGPTFKVTGMTDPVPASVDARLEALKAGVCTLEIRADNIGDNVAHLVAHQEDFHGPLIERLAEIERRQERARTEEAEQEKRLEKLEADVQAKRNGPSLEDRVFALEGARKAANQLGVSGPQLHARTVALEAQAAEFGKMVSAQGGCILDLQERLAKLEAQAGYVADLSVRVQALEALPAAQGLHPVAGTGLAQTLTNQRDAAIRERDRLADELRGRSACDATFNENTKQLMEERDSLRNQLDDMKSSFDTTTMALQTQLEEARAKLTKAEADFETPRGLVQYVVAAYRQEFEEAGELEGVIDLVRHAFVTLAERSKEISGLKERLKQSERTRDILVRQCDAAQGERNGISERQDQSRALCEDLEASLKTATANANQILENLGRVTRQRDELGSEVQRLLTLIPESDPRRDPNWKPEEAPPVGEIPQWVKDAKAAEHHSLLTDEERARGKALVEASARLAGVNPAIAEACERVAANVPAKPKASQRVVVLESAVRYGHFRPGTVGLISADQTSTPRGWVCVEFDDGRLTQNVPAEHLAFVQEAQP